MKRIINSKPKPEVARIAISHRTTQDLFEDYLRQEYRIAGCDAKTTEAMIEGFRRTFAGQLNHPPHPGLVAMMEAELQESTVFVERLRMHSVQKK